ncbi:hypothetical protein OG568_54900 (plasmid) [Streptomyces sp. NBC_01450]|jgi:hypothetical protein|uniref:hypothetical protein n=1 Tax=Streptomyces sp. NBC_01450 TaxID=2903871 RepID=UPI002E368115|nr:hypothetical protein [Streptomyces sp. NBC_01450]
MPEQLRKWSLTSGIVVKHMHYGLRVQVPSGEIGVVDRVDIADGYIEPADWPTVGSVLTVVGGGYAGRQLRLSTRPGHLEEARNRAARGQQAASGAKGDSPNS